VDKASTKFGFSFSMKGPTWPLTVEQYMNYALYDPQAGYYMTRFPLGCEGDFVTAPEISQLFGEMLGAWTVALWEHLGRPNPVHGVELGPGRGTLMSDVLRVARLSPEFHRAFKGHLVEISPMLAKVQKATLEHQRASLQWHENMDTLPEGPCIFLANEFFDALPVRQYVREVTGWHERLVDRDAQGQLFFRASHDRARDLDHPYASDMSLPKSTILEVNVVAHMFMSTLTQRLKTHGGVLLMVDYGASRSGCGDTLQALYKHKSISPLEHMGHGDLTAHVDFEALAKVSRREGGVVYGPVSQKDFLCALGIVMRAHILQKHASQDQREALESGLDRLLACGPTGMGELFQVMAISGSPLGELPGF
jgi:SAM-dependent MidA family methyltransferase